MFAAGLAGDWAGRWIEDRLKSGETLPIVVLRRPAWNKGRIIGQKRPLAPKHVWYIRVRLQMANNERDLALFKTAIDRKLRGCDLVCLTVRDVFAAG